MIGARLMLASRDRGINGHRLGLLLAFVNLMVRHGLRESLGRLFPMVDERSVGLSGDTSSRGPDRDTIDRVIRANVPLACTIVAPASNLRSETCSTLVSGFLDEVETACRFVMSGTRMERFAPRLLSQARMNPPAEAREAAEREMLDSLGEDSWRFRS